MDRKRIGFVFAAAFAALMWGGGCVTAPDKDKIDGALAVIAQGVQAGSVAWEQYEALKQAQEEAQATIETAPATEAEALAVVTQGASSGTAAQPQPPAVIPATAPPGGKALAVVLGNRATCGFCVKLWKQNPEAAVEAALPGVDLIDADKTERAALYAGYRPAGSFAWPLVRVFGRDGRALGDFSARNLTPEKLAAKIRALCPECAEAPRAAAAPDNRARAVVCGLTRVDPAAWGGWRGECPGSDTDAQVFAAACASNGIGAELLLNENCTADNVTRAAGAACARLEPGGLLILYLSGHGGQRSAAVPGSEADGKDETLCLWDGPLDDDAVWRLLCRVPEGVRIWMITDTCNSGTNYRGPRRYAAEAGRRGRGLFSRRAEPDLLHWGGCADGLSSYGTEQGGTFTTALVDAYESGQSYAAWFGRALRLMPASQRPTCEWTGRDFRDAPAFR